jgi:hypothetical protein
VKRELHIVLGGELKVLLKFLEPTTRKGYKALELKWPTKGYYCFTYSQEYEIVNK